MPTSNVDCNALPYPEEVKACWINKARSGEKDLRGADLTGADLSWANLTRATVSSKTKGVDFKDWKQRGGKVVAYVVPP